MYYGEILGDDRTPMYLLRYHGGPRNGAISNSFRPYDAILESDGSVYAARERGEACLVWVDDFTRAVDLFFLDDTEEAARMRKLFD